MELSFQWLKLTLRLHWCAGYVHCFTQLGDLGLARWGQTFRGFYTGQCPRYQIRTYLRIHRYLIAFKLINRRFKLIYAQQLLVWALLASGASGGVCPRYPWVAVCVWHSPMTLRRSPTGFYETHYHVRWKSRWLPYLGTKIQTPGSRVYSGGRRHIRNRARSQDDHR